VGAFTHEVDPGEEEKLPAEQERQLSAPAAENCPEAQTLHTLLPETAAFPALQMEQEAWPESVVMVPAGHGCALEEEVPETKLPAGAGVQKEADPVEKKPLGHASTERVLLR